MATDDQFREARSTLARRNITLAINSGDYRVNVKGGSEATAYYTDDLMEALRRGLQMADERDTKWSSS